MLTRPFAQPAVSIRRVHAIVNPASGGVEPGAADELAALFAELGLEHRVSELKPGELEGVVRAALDRGPDLVVSLGGDGTSRLVAEMCGPTGPLVAPLSGGTMNKLGRALYGPGSWREAIVRALTVGTVRWVPGGEVEGHAFFCRAVLGPPALWARAREAIRVRKLGRAWRRAVVARRKAFAARLSCDLDGTISSGLAVGLICPTVSRALDQDDGVLEAAVLDLHDVTAGVRLAVNNLLGHWRDDPDVIVKPCVRARIRSREAIPTMLDGEFFRLGREVEASIRPHAFRALAAPVEDEVGVAAAPVLVA